MSRYDNILASLPEVSRYLEAQERDLLAQGFERLWKEQTSALGPRIALEEAISFARTGDSLVVTKICRLALSVADLVAIIDRLEKKGVSLRILSMGIDTATPTGRLMLNLLASISQFEREVMLERQREGVAKAKLEGKYKGRKGRRGLGLRSNAGGSEW